MWYDWMWRLRWKWQQWWLRPVFVTRYTMGGRDRYTTKWVPRVQIYRLGGVIYGLDRRGVGVYWSPRKTAWEGEYFYKHYIRFTWPRLFGLDWQ